ncbi:hypothetical protein ACHAXN_009928 [Cyclotella atomus]
MVLSAAHCAGYSSTVELGRFDRKKGTPIDEQVLEDLLAESEDGVVNLMASDYYESIEVEYEIKHPAYDATTVDNDFLLLKLNKATMVPNPPIANLNTDPDVPEAKGTELLVMGWGDTDADPNVNTPSNVLLGADLNYLDNNECRTIEGEVQDEEQGTMVVSFRPMITENMMCAQDMPDGYVSGDDQLAEQDTCQGDSGSPMILPSKKGDWQQDLQVGVVSWGIGCASPIFPGVYSRVSSQYDWINEMVCEHSTAPPESFGCAGGGNNNTSTESDETDDTTVVTVEVWLDDKPKEFSWIMSTLNGGGFSSNQVVASIPSGYYHDWSNFTFQHKVQVKPNQFYRMSLRDKFGDGLRGYVAVYRGSVATTGNLIMYEPSFYNSDTGGKLRSDYGFFSGKEADSFLSLTINFDKYPMDTWWRLESVEEKVILAQRPPGYYNERFELMSVVERIPVFPEDHPSSKSEYKFTIGDSWPCQDDPTAVCGDGMCCDYGDGVYFLYEGEPSDDMLLATGGKFETSESKIVQTGTGKSIS